MQVAYERLSGEVACLGAYDGVVPRQPSKPQSADDQLPTEVTETKPTNIFDPTGTGLPGDTSIFDPDGTNQPEPAPEDKPVTTETPAHIDTTENFEPELKPSDNVDNDTAIESSAEATINGLSIDDSE